MQPLQHTHSSASITDRQSRRECVERWERVAWQQGGAESMALIAGDQRRQMADVVKEREGEDPDCISFCQNAAREIRQRLPGDH